MFHYNHPRLPHPALRLSGKGKAIYRLPTSAHMVELELQKRAYKDSLDKYCALLDTAQISHYLSLYQAARDTSGVVLREEANAFIAAVEEAASERNSLTTTECIFIYVAVILLIVLLIFLCTVHRLWTRIGWFFQDLLKWFKAADYHNASVDAAGNVVMGEAVSKYTPYNPLEVE